MRSDRRTVVYGPAYLDRVLRVDAPLLDPFSGGTLDGSTTCLQAELTDRRDRELIVVHERGTLRIAPPPEWPGPNGVIFTVPIPGWGVHHGTRNVRGVGWQDDLGGMGAGYAKALGGMLVSALGPEDEPTSQQIAAMLAREEITHRPIRVRSAADWTLLITSGEHGDKLAVGFRGCHAAVRNLGRESEDLRADLVVVAGLPNHLVAQALGRHPDAVRLLAPAMRNMTDHDPPLGSLAGSIDFLSCNRREWEALEDRESLARSLALLAITDGPNGCVLRYRTVTGIDTIEVPAFPRQAPPRDTNRAGEAFASTLVTAILDSAWNRGTALTADLVARVAHRASAAAALVIDRVDFGFPDPEKIDRAIRHGSIG